MIISYKKGNKLFKFYEPKEIDSSTNNIFTIIVGKNGSGKSRLLNGIIENFISLDAVRIHSNSKPGEVYYNEYPRSVIAVSTSPYDKFPIMRLPSYNKLSHGIYSYIGIRDIRNTNFSLGFMSKIIKELLYKKFLTSDLKEVFGVFNYLGYSDKLFITLEINTTQRQVDNFLKSQKTGYDFREIFTMRGIGRLNLSYFDKDGEFYDKRELNCDKVQRLLDIYDKYDFRGVRRRRRISISAKYFESDIYDIEDLLFLMESGAARLSDVELIKLETGKMYRISEASSGEQCIFTTFLGIACNIVNNSLIIIDEPEISLHPEWQEKYITLLIETFKNYKNCHFIIATHSPQIVSRLSVENCFILQMDGRELKNAKEIVNNSVDFQLVNVFDSPGFKNEYLARIAFSIISKVGKSGRFDEEDLKNFVILNSQIKHLQDNDPVKVLFGLIEELRANG